MSASHCKSPMQDWEAARQLLECIATFFVHAETVILTLQLPSQATFLLTSPTASVSKCTFLEKLLAHCYAQRRGLGIT